MKNHFLVLFICLFVCTAPFSWAADPAPLAPQHVATLKAARNAHQLILVGGQGGTDALLAFYEKRGSAWELVFSTYAYLGTNGLGKQREGDGKTPVGVYPITMAFGLAPDPGCALGYTLLDETHYWVSDSNSPFYNRLVSTRETDNFSKEKSEHLTEYVRAYPYALSIGYNAQGKPGLGSATFLHCASDYPATGGGVAIPEDCMRRLLRAIRPGCKIVIASQKNLPSY